jgi:hypothetical protein
MKIFKINRTLTILWLTFSISVTAQTNKTKRSESESISKWIDENSVSATAAYSLSEYSQDDRVIRFSGPGGSEKIASIPFNLPSGVTTSIQNGRVLVIEDAGGSTLSMGMHGRAKKIFFDLGQFFDRKIPEPKAKYAFLDEYGDFIFTSRELDRESLMDESLHLSTSFLFSDKNKKMEIRDGYRFYKSKSGATSVFYNPSAIPALLLGDNWRAVESIQKLSPTSFSVRDNEGTWLIEFKKDENTYSVVKQFEPAASSTEKIAPAKVEIKAEHKVEHTN